MVQGMELGAGGALVSVWVLTRVERESGKVGLDAAYVALENGELQ